MRPSTFAFGAALFLVMASASACSAQEGHGGHGGRLRAACGADIEKFCADVDHGKAACLRDHEADLSPDCKTALESFTPHHPPQGGGGQ